MTFRQKIMIFNEIILFFKTPKEVDIDYQSRGSKFHIFAHLRKLRFLHLQAGNLRRYPNRKTFETSYFCKIFGTLILDKDRRPDPKDGHCHRGFIFYCYLCFVSIYPFYAW